MVAFTCAGGALAQTPDASTDDALIGGPNAAPVAFVYLQSGSSKVYGFAAAANGELHAVPGSPYNYAVSPQAVNGKYLFGVKADGATIESYLMESTGALEPVDSLNTKPYDPHACGYPGAIHVDHSGQNLYNTILEQDCSYYDVSAVQSFKIDSANGQLAYIATTPADAGYGGVDVFLGNNKFAYAVDTFGFDSESDCGIDVYKRPSNGDLDYLGYVDMETLSPATNLGFTYYCANALAADPTNHIATLMEQNDGEDGVYGVLQIGVYTADSQGKLSTTSTYQNMPEVKTIGLYDPGSMRMSPSGKLLAVGGPKGLEIFHFNGADPATEFEVLLSNKAIGELYWDTSNHLYAEVGGNKLYVYTITPTSITEAPGSPYSIPQLSSLVVQSK
jgi:hypothetical protein